ncbi:MAG: DUF1343 domain-containing protein [Bacteroidales bacterium]|nr:DUF1343 domain-containing protein [Bacteroidales bacterium]
MRHLLLLATTILTIGTLHPQHTAPHEGVADPHEDTLTHTHLRTGADQLSTFHSPLSTFHSPLSTFHSPLSSFHFPLSTKKIALVANHTSLVARPHGGYTHLVDTLLSNDIDVVKIFCPEHGFRGTAAAGAHIASTTDSATGLPIISLYGKNKKPTPAQLQGVDIVIFDLQDVGCRFYTYISTLHYVMEACAEQHIPLLLLDRPNPNGHYVDGPVLDTAHLRSFVGMHPVPVVYGMTIGEYAMMINGEGWLNGGIHCNLTVLPLQGYTHSQPSTLNSQPSTLNSQPSTLNSQLSTLPTPPSPNLRNDHAIALYPSLCLFEGTRCGVGRGTPYPFEWVTFGNDTLDLRHETPPAAFSLHYLITMYRRVPKGQFFLNNNFFDKLAGTYSLRRQLEQGTPEQVIRDSWQPALDNFKKIREKYLIYK